MKKNVINLQTIIFNPNPENSKNIAFVNILMLYINI